MKTIFILCGTVFLLTSCFDRYSVSICEQAKFVPHGFEDGEYKNEIANHEGEFDLFRISVISGHEFILEDIEAEEKFRVKTCKVGSKTIAEIDEAHEQRFYTARLKRNREFVVQRFKRKKIQKQLGTKALAPGMAGAVTFHNDGVEPKKFARLIENTESKIKLVRVEQ
jgi:hypothetical protein